MQYKSYKTAATFTWSVSGLRHIFRSFTTWLIVSECLKVRVLCANRRWVQESRDQSNHRQVFGAASCLQPISPSNNQDSPGTTQNQLGNTHLSLTNSDCVAPNMADNFQETSSMCTWNRTKNLSPPLKKMRGEKKKHSNAGKHFFNSSITTVLWQ